MKINIDFETYSKLNVAKVGAYRYARDPSTGVICMSYSINNGEVMTWLPDYEDIPCQLECAIHDEDCTIHACNAEFEREILAEVLGLRLPASRFRCSSAANCYRALPASLRWSADYLGLTAKDESGKRTMMKWSKKATSAFDIPRADMQTIIAYCEQDVRVEQALEQRVGGLSDSEQKVWEQNVAMNERGFKVDVELVQAVRECIDIVLPKYLDEFEQLTGLKPTQNKAFASWIDSQGVPCDSVAAAAIKRLMMQDLPADVERALELRNTVNKTSIAKFKKIESLICPDGTIKGNLRYHAATTGRYSGAGVQLQNLPRGDYDASRLVPMFLARDINSIEAMGCDVFDAAKSCIRACLIATNGSKLIVADYSGIEARVLAWLADDQELLRKIEAGVDLYCDFGSKLFGRTITKADKRERQIAKVAVLGLGYSMGAKRFKETVFEWTGEVISPEEAQQAVDTYRQTFHKIKSFWWQLDQDAMNAVASKTRCGNFYTGVDEDTLHYQLPSGRVLTYWRPRLFDGLYGKQVGYDRPKDGKMVMTHSYGGKWTENICQAISRDLLVESLLTLDGQLTMLSTVHDEIIGEGSECSLELMESVMQNNPEWAVGLPLNVEGYVSDRFKK